MGIEFPAIFHDAVGFSSSTYILFSASQWQHWRISLLISASTLAIYIKKLRLCSFVWFAPHRWMHLLVNTTILPGSILTVSNFSVVLHETMSSSNCSIAIMADMGCWFAGLMAISSGWDPPIFIFRLCGLTWRRVWIKTMIFLWGGWRRWYYWFWRWDDDGCYLMPRKVLGTPVKVLCSTQGNEENMPNKPNKTQWVDARC